MIRAASLLLDVLAGSNDRRELSAVARACVQAQPTMAGLLTLEAAAGAEDPATAIRHLREQVRRAPESIARHASELLLLGSAGDRHSREIRLVTCSSSQAVESTLLAVAAGVRLTVCCAESRPKREGLGLAQRLASAGVAVQIFSDAGISAAVRGSGGVVVGADAVGPAFFVNKVGTGAICALASVHGVPVYVLAGREKILSDPVSARLEVVDGPPEQVARPSSGLTVRNPYFEHIPLDLATVIVTDAGVRPIAA